MFKGHPANRKDLAKDFDDLLADKTLEGVEAPGEEGGNEGKTKGEDCTIEDIENTMKEMNNFKEKHAKELQEALKNDASGMMRNFCVLTMEAGISTEGKWTNEYINHRVLVGPKAKVDACKKQIEEKMGNGKGEQGGEAYSFKLNEQYHE